ncbi:STY0301 family protein [Acidovorax sp. LjRoot117]|uniref:STY0301 family protein n=1 Tax=Acidovorax sp. LjRoot117 TaxID=3342255 RepID=UPI003F4F8BA6
MACMGVFLLIAPGSMALAMAQSAPGPDAMPTPSASVCPRSLQVQQTPLDKVPPDWQVRGSNKSFPLSNVGFYQGPPELLMQKVPYRTYRRGKTLHSQWIFPPSTQQYWVACEYSSTDAVATMPLDKSVTGCTAEHDLNTSPPTVKSWACQSTARP